MEADEKLCPKCAETIKAAAVVCKHCGFAFDGSDVPTPAPPPAKSHKLRNGCLWIIIAFVALSVISARSRKGNDQTSIASSASSGVPDATSTTAAPLEITAKELDTEYNANEAAAQQKYGNVPLMVSGRINSINLDMTNDAYLVLSGNNMFLGPQAHLDDISKPKAPALVKGQNVTVLCTGAKYIIGTVMLSDCVL